MKKILIAFTFAFTLTVFMIKPCIAQEPQESNKTQFGVKGGVNFSDLYSSDVESTQMLAGFNAGLFAKLPITPTLAFQPELYYTSKGAYITYNNLFVDGTATFKLNYVELPLLLVIRIADNFNISMGPYMSYLVSGKVKNDSNINLFDFEDNINNEDYNRFDAGIMAGASLDFRTVSFGARYSYGFTTVGKEQTYMGTAYTFPDANNAVINLFIAVPLRRN
jgi:hypothetical protein